MRYLLALDQGTSSSRALIFDPEGSAIAMAQQEFRQIFPRAGWVEHDPNEIWSSQWQTAQLALERAKLSPRELAAVGITNQRETTVLWDRQTGQALHNAIVWQDRRTLPLCEQLRVAGLDRRVQNSTGLRIDAYFSATKLRWLLDHIPGAQDRAEAGELAFGTIDSWLIWQLTRGRKHLTDVSNASRTMLWNIHTQQWDQELLQALRIPMAVLPQVLPSSADFGVVDSSWLGHTLPIAGVAGDQQAALFGQGCLRAGQVKNTYGTGCFMLMHTGDEAFPSQNGLITTRAAQIGPYPGFALEGSVFVGGAVVQWMRDQLKAFEHSADIEALASQVSDSQGVVLVPAFTGLGAPYWKETARGSLQGLTRGSGLAHIARAALESIALQSTALLQAMQRDTAARQAWTVEELRVDGGACANNLLMQIQADLLGLPVIRPRSVETTALGAALLAGSQVGLIKDPLQLRTCLPVDRIFEPQRSRDWAQHLMAQWEQAVERCG
ncbi:MAG: glycerol kinase GlpK [Betaproteobacteria bacterium]|nr:glycerol kinase GlpK [Betaproteobacteria bacterium]